jgi:3-methyladenine DNA glycosylase Mpg
MSNTNSDSRNVITETWIVSVDGVPTTCEITETEAYDSMLIVANDIKNKIFIGGGVVVYLEIARNSKSVEVVTVSHDSYTRCPVIANRVSVHKDATHYIE